MVAGEGTKERIGPWCAVGVLLKLAGSEQPISTLGEGAMLMLAALALALVMVLSGTVTRIAYNGKSNR